MATLYLIDHSSFACRFQAAIRDAYATVTGVRVNTSVLQGYVHSLSRNKYRDILIVLDGTPLRALRLLPSYKGTRVKPAEESLSIPYKEVVWFLSGIGAVIGKNIRVVCLPGHEADEVIASLTSLALGDVSEVSQFILDSSRMGLEEDARLYKCYDPRGTDVLPIEKMRYDEVVIGTTDSDISQLAVDVRVRIDSGTLGRDITTDTGAATAHLFPSLVPLYKALLGDVSDNIPGLPLPWKKSEVVEMLRGLDRSQAEAVVRRVVSLNPGGDEGVELPRKVCEMIAVVRLQSQKEFIRNYQIVKLGFVGTPYVLQFPYYDIRATIERYKIRW